MVENKPIENAEPEWLQEIPLEQRRTGYGWLVAATLFLMLALFLCCWLESPLSYIMAAMYLSLSSWNAWRWYQRRNHPETAFALWGWTDRRIFWRIHWNSIPYVVAIVILAAGVTSFKDTHNHSIQFLSWTVFYAYLSEMQLYIKDHSPRPPKKINGSVRLSEFKPLQSEHWGERVVPSSENTITT
jgi:hypothetical protein